MDDIAGNIEKLKVLRDLGMKLSIDDFGAGYFSLGLTLVPAMISLARALMLTVVAEGVEQEEQAKMLRCAEMQGYLFSKPLPIEELTALPRKSE